MSKTYLVKASTLLTDEELQKLRDGVTLGTARHGRRGSRASRDSARQTYFEITLTEGRNRQVRRMVEAVGARVVKLARVNIGPIAIGTLPGPCEWRRARSRGAEKGSGRFGNVKSVRPFLLPSHTRPCILVWETNMSTKTDVWQGTLALMVLKTLNAMGPQHGYGIARRIEQTSDDLLSINHGTLYPILLKLEQEGAIASEWGVSENNRRAQVLPDHEDRTETARLHGHPVDPDDRHRRPLHRAEGRDQVMTRALRRTWSRLLEASFDGSPTVDSSEEFASTFS